MFVYMSTVFQTTENIPLFVDYDNKEITIINQNRFEKIIGNIVYKIPNRILKCLFMKISILFLLFSSIVYAKDIRVLIIDTGVDLSHEEIRSHIPIINTIDYNDTHGHGTHVAGLILKDTCPQVKLISCKYYYKDYEKQLRTSNDCFELGLRIKPDYINYSSGGSKVDFKEFILFTKLVKQGTKIMVAAGNSGKERPDFYPARYEMKGVTIVGNLNPDGTHNSTSNYGFKEMVWEIGTKIESTFPDGKRNEMTGTSQATAIYLNKQLRLECFKLR